MYNEGSNMVMPVVPQGNGGYGNDMFGGGWSW